MCCCKNLVAPPTIVYDRVESKLFKLLRAQIYTLLVLFVCLFVIVQRHNGRSDRAQMFCGTSQEGLWIIKILKISLK